MTRKIIQLELKILDMLSVDDMVLIAGKLIGGDIYGTGEVITNIRCIETSSRWKLAAIGFDTPKGQKEGIRLIGIEHIEGSKDLEPGFTLVSEET